MVSVRVFLCMTAASGEGSLGTGMDGLDVDTGAHR